MFGAIKAKAAKVKALNQDKLLNEIFNEPTLQAQIVDLNQHQLYDLGVQADGTETGLYSLKTIAYKQMKGDARGVPGKSDHITGLDTGLTYDSMNVKSMPDGIVINANDRNDFFAREPKGLGLTKESIAEIIPEVREQLIEKIRAAI